MKAFDTFTKIALKCGQLIIVVKDFEMLPKVQ